MIRIFQRGLAMAAAIAMLTLVSPVQAQTQTDPCLLTDAQVAAACLAYENPNNEARKNYLQAHLIKPQQPVNICGCLPEVATFCDPSLIFPAAESCPPGQGGITGLDTQATVTTGTATCQRVISGGRVLYIGDTCF